MLFAYMRGYLGRSVGVLAFLMGMAAASPLAAQNSPEEVAAAYLATWNAHDPDAAAMLLADDVVYLDVTVGEPQKGRARQCDPRVHRRASRSSGSSAAPIPAPGSGHAGDRQVVPVRWRHADGAWAKTCA
jgi:SnoaL-like domain